MTQALPKAIFFDWDGTLVDSFRFLESAHNHVMNNLDIPSRKQGWFESYFGRPREEIYANIYGDLGGEARSQFEEFVSKNHHQLQPMTDAENMLSFVRDTGLQSGIVSNKKGDFVRREVSTFGWDDFFGAIIGAGEAGLDKPAADPLLLAIKQAKISAPTQDIWYVGDTEMDLKCAENAGCTSIFIENIGQNESVIKNYQPLRVFKNCTQLHEFLLQCAEN